MTKLTTPATLRRLLAFAAMLPALSLAQTAETEEQTQARFQTTYVWQQKAAFPAAYSGVNSLSAEREKSYTFTTTAYLGFRPWRHGEIYLDAEVGQGVAFSDLSGTAGFTNGEVTRIAGTNPEVYRQRLFLRQTWNLGGASEAVESDVNQLAGAVDKNRFVLTIGNFSTLDIFDDNAYAKDPRTQFMNWGNMSYAAYDYAADARGFGWGAVGEWYGDDWVLRFGRMTGPREPNMLPMDYSIGRHYGDQLEIEHDHQFAGQPGKIRVLAWRNKALLATYADALAYLRSHPGGDPETILRVRNGDRIKYGLGLNVEQAIDADLGVFLRLMRADGRSETYAFTEADGSLATGLALKGSGWSRARDTLGVSYMRNTISADRRAFLEAGGISFFIGDGALNYRPETIFESYYSWSPAKNVSLTADLQRIANPAYNADRGPVRIVGLRFHAEY